ncbi:MAG: bifunctional nuclease family protein [Clostridia bacterium]
MIEVRVKLVGLDPRGEQRVVVLEEVDGNRYLSLPVGPAEAEAIAAWLEGERDPGRPLAHDLLHSVIQKFGGRLRRVVITELRHDALYAELELEGPGGPESLPCRPSDGVALAIRAGAPVLVTQQVAGQAMRRISRHPRPPDHPPAAG